VLLVTVFIAALVLTGITSYLAEQTAARFGDGTAAFWGIASPILAGIVFVAATATIAYATALCEFACVERWQPSLGIAVMILPAVALFMWEMPVLRGVGVAMLLYAVYLLGPQLGRRMRDYEAQMAIEYDLLSSRAEMARLARCDPLTGLANRLEYHEVLGWLWKQSRRQAATVSMLVIDLDHFKVINDRFGHDGEDACLKHVAAVLRRCFRRETDLVARIGGEEFAVVLPNTTIEAACRLANDFCLMLATMPFEVEGVSHSVTASVGVASSSNAGGTTPDALFSRADAACYDAKHNGRNQVVQRV
jgi:diguanylate cyclase (GGDEF)-like protein